VVSTLRRVREDFLFKACFSLRLYTKLGAPDNTSLMIFFIFG